MSTRYLLAVSLAMIAVALAGLIAMGLLRANVPTYTGGYDWARIDARGERRSDAEQRAVVATLGTRVLASRATRFLTSGDQLATLAQEHANAHTWQASDPQPYRVAQVIDIARFHATIAIVLFAVLLMCGLLGLARLRVDKLVAIANGLNVLALLGGGAILYVTDGATIAALTCIPLVLGFFGQLIAANLLPGSDEHFVVETETRLRALSPARRRLYLVTRIGLGALITTAGLALTLTIATLGGILATAPIALVIFGSALLVTPVIASIRMHARDRELALRARQLGF